MPQKHVNRMGLRLFVLLCLFVAHPVNNDAQGDEIRVDTDLVTIPTAVLNRDGRYITDLKKESFQIFENGIEHDVVFFESVNEPFTVFLLIDRSNSMTDLLGDLGEAANAFISQLRPDDQVIVASFGNDVEVLTKGKVGSLGKGIRVRKHAGDTHTMLYDAVDYSLKKLKKIQGRKAVVIFTDGVGSGIFASFKENLRDAEEGEAMIYTVQFNPFTDGPKFNSREKYFGVLDTANEYMRTLPAITGGRSFRIEEIASLERTFAEIAREVGQQYRLGYYAKESSKKGERRKIKVKVNISDAVVRARSSYIVGVNKR
jgi:VWFA-related protein